jgi:hypothetical protein
LKQHKLWFDKECSKLLGQQKQAKLQLLQTPSQTNGDDLNNVRHESSITYQEQKEGKKINELETNSKNKNVRN